jgi:dihydropyrimidinase
MVEGALPPEIFGQLAEAIRDGYPTVKIFTTDITPSRRGRMVDFGDIWEVFQVVARAARPVRDARRGQRHRDAHVREADPRGPGRLRAHGRGAQRAVRGPLVPARHPLAENVPGMALYFMHVSAASGVEAMREARARGFPSTARRCTST